MSFIDRASQALQVLRGGAELPSTDTAGGRMMAGVLRSGGDPPPRSAAAYEAAFSTSPWLRAALSRISYDVAAVDWQLFRPKGARRRSLQRSYGAERKRMIGKMVADSELEPVEDHPLLDLLHSYNPVHTGLQARQLKQIYLDSIGEAFLMVERNKLGKPMELWPIPPSWVMSTPTPSKPFFEMRFRGWEGNIPASEVVWYCHADPANPYGRGTGVARALADELETDEYAAKMTKSMFFNRARPDIIVSPQDPTATMGDTDVRRLEEDWNRNNRGFWRAFRAYFLKRAVNVQTIDTSFESLQFIELREYERNCYDEQTEALTKRGWVPGTELRGGDEVLGWDGLMGRWRWRKPRELIRQPYRGEMHHWKNQRVDVCVTPNHRMLAKSPNEYSDWGFRRSDACRKAGRLVWRIAGEHPGAGVATVKIPNVNFGKSRPAGFKPDFDAALPYYELDSGAFAKWLGYWVSEGHLMQRHDDEGRPTRFGMSLSQTRSPDWEPGQVDTVVEMVEASDSLACFGTTRVRQAGRTTRNGRSIHYIDISNESLWKWLAENCGTHAKNKHLPRCAFSWTREAQEALLEALIDGDGNRYATGARYLTASRQLADDVQELAVILGLRSSLRQDEDGMYCVQLTSRKEAWVKSSACESVNYDGMVWCVDIEGDAFVTRRNGKIAVHGNTCLQVFGVPPEILGIISTGSARATITMADIIYTKRTIIPRLEFQRAVGQERLLPEYDDDRLVLDYVSPNVEDVELQLEAGKAAPFARTVDEWREAQGLDPLPDEAGNVHIVGANLTAYESPAEVQGVAATGGRRETDERSARSEKDLPQSGRKSVDPDSPPLVQIGQRNETEYVREQEAAWGNLTADVDDVARALVGNDIDGAMEAFGGVGTIADAMAEPAERLGRENFLRGARFAADNLPSPQRADPLPTSFSAVNPEATAWAQANAAELVSGVDQATRDAIARLVVMSNEQGIPVARLARMMVEQDLITLLPRQAEAVAKFRAKMIEQGLAGDVLDARVNRYIQSQIRSRARMIARTETMKALNEGQQALWSNAQKRGVLPKGTRRKWIATLDEILEPLCESLHGVEVELGESFPGGYMSPPAHPGCRCTTGISHVPFPDE